MKNLKAHEKNQLFYEFGLLIQPLENLVNSKKLHTAQEYRLAIAKVIAGDNTWRRTVRNFTTFAPDVFLAQECQKISHVPEHCLGAIGSIINDSSLQDNLEEYKKRIAIETERAKQNFLDFVERVPVDWEPVVFEANTPFTSYLRIKESIVSVRQRLHYFDRYLKPDFFTLFLAEVPNTVSIRLVTTAGDQKYGVESVRAVSRLFSQQYGDYQLIEIGPEKLHDRNLRVDNQIFTLGPGVDRAGLLLTNFGPTDSSQQVHSQFDQIIADGAAVN